MTPKLYEGTKRLLAQPMTRGAYNQYRGWDTPADENPADPGYLVEYQDGGKANSPSHAGYISWSPADVFERSYKEVPSTVRLNFGDAIQLLKDGARLARTGWNGRGMFIYLVPAASYPVQTGAAKAHFGAGAMVPYNAYLAIKNVDETVSTWVPSVSDCLAQDWVIVGDVAATADLQGAYAAGKLAYESGGPSASRPDYTDAEHDAWSRGWNDSAEASPLAGHASDCAVHNEPAMPAGSCDCATRVPGALEPKAYADGTVATGRGPLPEVSPSDQPIQAEIQAKGLTAPRVTQADIEAEFLQKTIYNLADYLVCEASRTTCRNFEMGNDDFMVILGNNEAL